MKALKSLRQETSQSALIMAVIPASEGVKLLLGDDADTAWAAVFGHFMRRYHQTPRSTPIRCSACDEPLKRAEFSVAIGLPKDNPRHGIAVAICDDCADTPEQRATRSREALLAVLKGGVK